MWNYVSDVHESDKNTEAAVDNGVDVRLPGKLGVHDHTKVLDGSR